MIRQTKLSISPVDRLFLDIQLQCVYMHVAEQKDRWECAFHTHEYLEFGFIYKGTGLYHIDGVDYQASAGDVFIIPANVEHFEVNHPDCPFEIIFLMVKHVGKNTEEFNNHLGMFKGKVHPNQGKKVREIFDNIYDEIMIKAPGYLALIDAQLKSLYLLLYRQIAAAEEPGLKEPQKAAFSRKNLRVLEKINAYLLLHMDEKCTIESIAQHFFYHPKYLSQIIKRETGKTLSDYIQAMRIEKSRELLSQSDIPIEQIAEKLGFSSVQHFYKRFKTEVGVTPNMYRNNYLNAPRDPL